MTSETPDCKNKKNPHYLYQALSFKSNILGNLMILRWCNYYAEEKGTHTIEGTSADLNITPDQITYISKFLTVTVYFLQESVQNQYLYVD